MNWGQTAEPAYLIKRIATWMDLAEEKEKAQTLYMRLVVHKELETLSELDLIELMEFFMDRKDYSLIIGLGEEILKKKPDLMRVALYERRGQ